MQNEPHRVLRHLLHDHGNMLRILAVLEIEITRHRKDGIVDVDLLKSILQYALTYPDLRHHPREDKLLERMLFNRPLEAEAGLNLVLEHKHLGEMTRRLSAALYHLERGNGATVEEFDELATSYIKELREHMHGEESSFFRTAMHVLTSEDWRALDEKVFPAAGLATVGDGIDDEYQALHDKILARVG